MQAIRIALLAALLVSPQVLAPRAQAPSPPTMTPDEAARMADQIMKQFGAVMGVDPDTLENATEQERRELLREGADDYVERMRRQMEQRFGVSLDEMENLSEDEMRELMMGGTGAGRPGPGATASPLALPPAPARGFPDGSIPVPIGPDRSAHLGVTAPPGQQVILVAVDMTIREIVLREERTIPFEAQLQLDDFSRDPSRLLFEVIDAGTHRVIHRYRPVAASDRAAERIDRRSR